MTDYSSSPLATKDFGVRDFYLGRQPIVDRNQALFGYELLFRRAPSGAAQIDTGLSATAAVIAHAGQLGLEKVIGDAQGFINADADVIMSDIFVFLPRERVVLEVAGTVEASAPLLARMAELAGHGFRFALDDVDTITPNFERMLPMIDFVKFDMREMTPSTLLNLAPRLKRDDKKLVAEKVETRAEYDTCRELGFDYFQGYYFAKPVVIGGRKLTPSQLAILELMKLVTSDAENIAIERAVKRDVTLALNLLRLVNTPAVGMRQRIDSVSQALIVLGRRQLQRWLQIMLYAEPATRGHNQTPLLMLATTRGRLMELLAQRLRPGQRVVADIAFTVGIMSLMDVLFGIPMTEIVEQIPVSDEVRQALVGRAGFFGELLKLSESIEQADENTELVLPTLKELQISGDDMIELEMSAFQWSDSVVRYAI
jgi:EAL and modified HD-GYP domain-containing signal transduction protein